MNGDGSVLLTACYAILFYAAFIIMAGGLAFKIRQYARTPAPLKIPVTPAPVSTGGVIVRMALEVVLFYSLFRSNKWIWLFGWMFHAAMALVLLRHFRYITEPVWAVAALAQPFGLYAGFAMLGGLLALWARRFVVERVRYISNPSDHLMLALLVGIVVSGFAMQYVAHVDIVGLKSFMLGMIFLDWRPLPADPVLLIHLGLVATLMIVFPFSKLLHAPGVFFSPSRYQVDNAREKRHVASWKSKMGAAPHAGD
jgi:nitrate reductase gamma subunit